MSNEKILLDLEVKAGNSGQNIKSVRAELRELQQQMAGLDPSSKAFITAAQRAGELQDRMADVKASVKAFNPEQKFQAFAGVLGGVASGFSVAQGAMAIFGDKNKDLEKIMLQTQAAIAIATGVNGLLGMKDQFIILGNVIKTQVVAAFGTMRAAIISTGILGLVALIGTLIYNWYEQKKANDAATKALEDYNEALKKTRKEQQGLAVELLDGRTKELAQITNETTNKILELSDKISAIRKKAAEENRDLSKAELLEIESYKQQQITINEIGEKKISDTKKQYAKEDSDARKKKEEEDKQKNEDRKNKEKKDYEDRMQRLKQELEANSAIAEMKLENARRNYEGVKNYYDKEISDIEKIRDLSIKSVEDQRLTLDARQQVIKEALQRGYITEKEYVELDRQLKDQKAANQLWMANQITQTITNLGQIAGINAEQQKKLSIATTLIDTFFAAQKAYTSQMVLLTPDAPIRATIAATSAVIAGLARVAAISRVNVNSPSPSPSAGGGGAPSAPRMPQNTQGISLMGTNQPVLTRNVRQEGSRVYVLESDITEKQKSVNGIKQKAKIK